jgi:hypothetical protein
LVATWEGDSNHRSPPLVRKGEPVEIFKRNNQDKYYWRPSGRGRDFRSTDRVSIEISARDPKKPGVEIDDTNTYSAYLDSENKRVGFKTSKANGEVAAFSMEVDLKAGTLYITDDTKEPGNRIFLDTGVESGKSIFQVNLSTGSTFKLEDKDAFIKIPGMLQIDAGDRIVMNSPLTVFNISKKGVIIFNAAHIAFHAVKDFVVACGIIGLNGATKIGGVLAASRAKIGEAVKAPVSGEYKPADIDRPEETPVKVPSNSADANMAGTPYRAP